MGTCTYQIEWWQDPQKKVSQIPSKRNELQASLKILGYFSPKWKVVLYHYNIFLFISKLNYDLTFGNHPSEIILRYASDYPPAPYSSSSFGTPRITLRRLILWPMKTCHVGKFNFPHPKRKHLWKKEDYGYLHISIKMMAGLSYKGSEWISKNEQNKVF